MAKLNHRQRRENRLNFTLDNFAVHVACAENDKGDVKVINDNVSQRRQFVVASRCCCASFSSIIVRHTPVATNTIDFRCCELPNNIDGHFGAAFI